jgi:hypothetical protein
VVGCLASPLSRRGFQCLSAGTHARRPKWSCPLVSRLDNRGIATTPPHEKGKQPGSVVILARLFSGCVWVKWTSEHRLTVWRLDAVLVPSSPDHQLDPDNVAVLDATDQRWRLDSFADQALFRLQDEPAADHTEARIGIEPLTCSRFGVDLGHVLQRIPTERPSPVRHPASSAAGPWTIANATDPSEVRSWYSEAGVAASCGSRGGTSSRTCASGVAPPACCT